MYVKGPRKRVTTEVIDVSAEMTGVLGASLGVRG